MKDTFKHLEKNSYLFDNGGVSIDRYTYLDEDNNVWGFSSQPFAPHGFAQFCGNINDWGQQRANWIKNFLASGNVAISFDDLNEDCQYYVKSR